MTQAKTTEKAAAGKASEKDPGTKPGKKVLHVHCPRERFRRGGREFSRGKNVVHLEELTKAQHKALLDEPLLAVTMHDAEDEAEA